MRNIHLTFVLCTYLAICYVVPVKSKVKISQNCVAFSDYMNFNNFILFIDCLNTCGLKICSEKCQITHQRHDNEECLLVKRVKDKNFDQWLCVLRVLKLKKSNTKLWTSFNMLEDHREDRKDCQIMKQNKSSNLLIRSKTQS